MRLIFIRHGNPDYQHDCLTEKGWREAECLAKRVSKWENISEIYVSPLGRAKETASLSLKALNREGIELPWLQEFPVRVIRPTDNKLHVPWDFYPSLWINNKDAFDVDKWYNLDLFNGVDIKTETLKVYDGIDGILLNHGYRREGNLYVTDHSGKDDTIVFFCHLGVSFVMMGHLMNISPFALWHTMFVAGTAVTVISSEERDGDFCHFRTQFIGDTSHLVYNGEPVGIAGYFTEPFQG